MKIRQTVEKRSKIWRRGSRASPVVFDQVLIFIGRSREKVQLHRWSVVGAQSQHAVAAHSHSTPSQPHSTQSQYAVAARSPPSPTFIGAFPPKVQLRYTMSWTWPWHPLQSGMLPMLAPWPLVNTTFSTSTPVVSFLMQTLSSPPLTVPEVGPKIGHSAAQSVPISAHHQATQSTTTDSRCCCCCCCVVVVLLLLFWGEGV